MAELIQTILKAIPMALWPILVLLFLWGLGLIAKQFYSLFHQARKSYISELKEHLNFKETVINDYCAQNTQLQMQNYEIKMEAEKKQELINETIETALAIMTEKETELQTLRSEIQQMKFAFGTALWMIERETWLRRVFLAILVKARVPSDIVKVLEKYTDSITPIMQSDDAIYFQEVDPEADYFEAKATVLAPHYLQLPIKEDISLMENIREELLTLPSFVDPDNPPSDNKAACREGADDKT